MGSGLNMLYILCEQLFFKYAEAREDKLHLRFYNLLLSAVIIYLDLHHFFALPIPLVVDLGLLDLQVAQLRIQCCQAGGGGTVTLCGLSQAEALHLHLEHLHTPQKIDVKDN